MAGKMSKTNVAARAEQRANVNKTCRFCGQEIEVALVVVGRGKTRMVRLCCERAGVAQDQGQAAG
ncbi:MAG: hypothetical protein IT204_03280 [Fimbriimonadaceae bacterium]|nr:hypothetical protein [Fimbriimonadaceae bacterium]